MQCNDFQGQLSDHLNGALGTEQADALEAHLSGCAECRAVLADLRWVAGLLQGVEPEPMPVDLGAKVFGALAALDDEQPSTTAPRIPCDEAHDYMSGHLEGDLDDWEDRALAGHLDDCADCRLVLEQMVAVRLLLRAVPRETLPAGFETRIHDALEALDRPASPCGEVRERLSERLDGSLPAEDERRVAAHLDGCADCRVLADQLLAVRTLLRAVPRETVPAGLVERIQSGLAAEPEQLAERPAARRRFNWPSAFTGAVAAAAAVFFIWQTQPSTLPQIQTAAVSANTNVAVNIGFDVAKSVDGVTFQIDLPEGLQFVDDDGKPMLAQSVAWKGALEEGKTVVPIVVRGMRPGRYEIQAYVRKGPMRQKTTIVLPVVG